MDLNKYPCNQLDTLLGLSLNSNIPLLMLQNGLYDIGRLSYTPFNKRNLI